jgi:choice-of-anchor C domain-containing protein
MLSAVPIARADDYDCSRDENGAWVVEGLPGGENLVVNGDFETPTANKSYYEVVAAGRRWGSWLVGGSGGIDVVRLWESASGSQSIDLNGTPGMGSISQVLDTVPGKSYLLRFAMSGNGYAQNEPAVKTMQLWWNGALLDTLSFDTTGQTLDDMGWIYHTYQLPAATRPNAELKFASTTPVSAYGPAVDDVKVLDPAAAPNVLANDSAAGGSLSALLVEGPSHGTLVLHDDGTFAYVPRAGFTGVDTFTYRASDGQLQSEPATVSISVISTNDPPTAENDSFATDEDAVLVVEAAASLLTNDADPNGDALLAVLAEGPLHGTFGLNDDGTFTYVPDTDFNGTDSFTYRTSDGQSESNLATVTISVHPVNDVRGTVFEDVNENGSRDEGELGLEGYTVYADQNENGALDQGEVAVLTGPDGGYAFAGLVPGEYTIRQVHRENHFPTVPADRSGFAISVDSGDLCSGLDLGNLIVAAEAITSLPPGFPPGMLHGLDATGGDLWFSFVAEREGRIMVRANSASVQLTLYDAEGYQVFTESDGRGNQELLHQPVAEGQVFYLRISSAEFTHRKLNVSLHVLPPADRGQRLLAREHDRRGDSKFPRVADSREAQRGDRTASEACPVEPTAGGPVASGFVVRARMSDAIHARADFTGTLGESIHDLLAENRRCGKRSSQARDDRAGLFDAVHGSAQPASVGPF